MPNLRPAKRPGPVPSGTPQTPVPPKPIPPTKVEQKPAPVPPINQGSGNNQSNTVVEGLNLSSGNAEISGFVLANNVLTSNAIQIRGNVTGGNLVSSTEISAVGLISGANLSVSGNLTVGANLVGKRESRTNSATGTAGEITWDANYIYICVARNTWKRLALSSW